jgi:hypothetical protein
MLFAALAATLLFPTGHARGEDAVQIPAVGTPNSQLTDKGMKSVADKAGDIASGFGDAAVVGAPPLAATASAISAPKMEGIEALQSGVQCLPDAKCRPESLDEARHVIEVMMSKANPALIERMAEKKIQVFIVPHGKDLTDAPPFVNQKGTAIQNKWYKMFRKTEGIANAGALVVTEADLLNPKNGPKYAFMAHEYGHVVSFNLPQAKDDSGLPTMDEFFGASEKATGAGLRGYAKTSDLENTAEATSAFFGVGFEERGALVRGMSVYAGGGIVNSLGQYRRIDDKVLRAHQPDLYDELVRVYGPPRSIGGESK